MCVYVSIHTHTYVFIYVYINAHNHLYIHIIIYNYICIHLSPGCVFSLVPSLFYTYIYINTEIYIYKLEIYVRNSYNLYIIIYKLEIIHKKI